MRLNSDGSLDNSFNTGTGFDYAVLAISIQGTSSIMVGGDFYNFNGNSCKRIARINTNGSLDTSFNPGTGFDSPVETIALQADGKIIAGGWFTYFNGTARSRIARLNSNGTLDTTFNIGAGFNDFVFSVSLHNNGNIIVGGRFTSLNGLWRHNIARLFATDPPFQYSHHAKGSVYADLNTDCIKQITDIGLPFTLATVPSYSYAYSDSSGEYSLGINDSINYLIIPIIPQRLQHFVSNPCPANYSVLLDVTHPQDTAGFDFGFDYDPCHQLRVDVGSSRRRRCFLNTTSVYYTNEGIIPANGVEVIVKMPEYVIPISASIPYIWNTTDSTMIFNIGTLNDNQSGTITIIDSVACMNGITGLTQCTKAWITPPNSCIMNDTVGSAWDKSSILVEGNCVNDTVVFVIYNTGNPGDGDMTTPSQCRIYADNALMQTIPFQINGGDSLVITIVSGGATIRLEADQHPGHPGNSHPNETIEACGFSITGTFSIGMVNLAPQDDQDLHVEIECLQIIDSYDPNDKNVTPAGVGPNKIVMPGTLLDYTIRFQNTGSDTAYKVVVIDTLSSFLDISTLELGTSSFPYTFSMSGAGSPVLNFSFNDINLTDTMTSEVNSHGFVKFKIAPFDTVPLGTIIENFVDIFFDYNLPIRTNTISIKIDSLTYTNTDLAEVLTHPILNPYYCEGDSVSFEAVFTGNNLTYQWFKNGLEVIGATTNTLLIDPISVSNTGYYYCRASGHLNLANTIELMMNVKEHTFAVKTETACETYTLNNQTYTTSGTYTQLIQNAAGCDSTITLNLTIDNSTTSSLTETACETYTLNSQTYAISGTYTQLIQNAAGCDSTITLNLTIDNSTALSLTETACETYTLNSQTYTTSGTYTQLIQNAAGCDSTITLNLTIGNSTTSSLTETACETYTLNSQIYTTSGTYTQMLTNATGCDSTITLNLTIGNSTISTLNEIACENYSLNGQTYTTSGTYTQMLTNASGCDSTITLNLTIGNSTTSTINETICKSYNLNGQIYITSGTYTQTLTSASGCDSTITLNLIINTVDTSVDQNNVMLTATPTGAFYQWLDCDNSFSVIVGEINQSYSASTDGSYAVMVTQNNCSDTSYCYAITGTSIKENTSGNRIVIYPNPTSGNITLVSDLHLNKARVKIITLTGQVIFEKDNLNGNSFNFDISKQARGVYFMEINHKDAITRLKLIVN
ncbi:MAG: T9SS type A sorting domain-containing protein [Bacteroidota bacterium]|nr:T9SS type A sorting domain-containing protein [Bacteroidota bacterium]